VAARHIGIAGWIFILVLLSVGWPAYGAADSAKITYLKGKVTIGAAEKGPWQIAESGMPVSPGHFVKTAADGYLELSLPDGSVIRLAPETVFKIEAAQFQRKQSRLFAAKLFLGKIWAKVVRAVGRSGDDFTTRTATAVAGVRGTVYDMRAAADRSTDIWVYEGRIAVGPPLLKEGAEREEIAWPREVDEKVWEEIVLAKLQRLHIGPDGRPGKPAGFDPEKEKDAWTEWNLERDAAGQ
jgi:ferric-dicitrate binding protein FerR (iron transport regulator)